MTSLVEIAYVLVEICRGMLPAFYVVSVRSERRDANDVVGADVAHAWFAAAAASAWGLRALLVAKSVEYIIIVSSSHLHATSSQVFLPQSLHHNVSVLGKKCPRHVLRNTRTCSLWRASKQWSSKFPLSRALYCRTTYSLSIYGIVPIDGVCPCYTLATWSECEW